MTGQPPMALQNFQFFHREIAHFFPSPFQFFLCRRRCAEFMRYAGNQTQNCDELHHRLLKVGKKIYILIWATLLLFFSSPALLVKRV